MIAHNRDTVSSIPELTDNYPTPVHPVKYTP